MRHVYMIFSRDFSDLDLYIKVIEGAQQLDKETRFEFGYVKTLVITWQN